MSESRSERTSDAAKVAGGGGITFLGILTDRGLRWVVSWLLSGVLGSSLYGIYAVTTKAFVPLVGAVGAIGLDTGIVYFGARYRKADDPQRLKGILQLGAAMAVLSSVATAALVWHLPDLLCPVPTWATWIGLSEQQLCEDVRVPRWGAVIVGLWIPLLFLIGALRARKDMKRSALAFQVTLPLTLIAGVGLSVLLGGGLEGALAAYVVAAGAAVLVAARFCWRHYGALLRDRAVPAIREPGTLLAFSVPQALAGMVFRLNMRMDVLMLYGMASSTVAGRYDIAAGLAVLGYMPVPATITMFNPMISELVATGERQRLDALLKTVTRWLILISLPAYTVLILIPDIVLSIYKPEYLAALPPLVILCCGQLINVACSPTMRLIPMSGHTTLNLINGIVAAALGITLNVLLIPEYGGVGAAWATAITMSAWGLWRVGEVWYLLRCFPFTGRSLGFLLGHAAAMAAVHFITNDSSLLIRLSALGGLLIAYAFAARTFGITDEDEEIVQRVTGRLRRLLGRSG